MTTIGQTSSIDPTRNSLLPINQASDAQKQLLAFTLLEMVQNQLAISPNPLNQQLFEVAILRLKHAKIWMKNNPRYPFEFCIAGRVFRQAIDGIQDLRERQPLIHSNGNSINHVFVGKKIVIKKYGRATAHKETWLIHKLFPFYSGNALTPTIKFNNCDGFDQLEIHLNPKILQRSFNFKKRDVQKIPSDICDPTIKNFMIKHINYFNSKTKKHPLCYLSPKLKASPDDLTLKAYMTCENLKWESENHPKGIDFKEIHSGVIIKQDTEISDEVLGFISEEDVERALETKFRLSSTHLFQVSSYNDGNSSMASWRPLESFFVQPLANTILFEYYKDENWSPFFEVILSNLSPENEFNAILLGQFQFYDLHSKNLGLTPQLPEHLKDMLTIPYFVNEDLVSEGETWTFDDLIATYCCKKDAFTDVRIRYTRNSTLYDGKVENLPDLKQALTAEWKFEIFDTDRTLHQSNLIVKDYLNRYAIPFRCALLQTEWKDKPLSQVTIDRLLNDEVNQKNMFDWIRRKHAPYRQMFSKEILNRIDQFKYDRVDEITINETCDLQKNLSFWQILEKHMKLSFNIQEGDTLESIAERHNVKVTELNPQEPLIPGNKIDCSFHLTKEDTHSLNRRKAIAKQFVHHLNCHQQKALTERLVHTKQYLLAHREFKNSNASTPMELFNSILKYLASNPPLNALEKNTCKELLRTLTLENLQNVKKRLCTHTQPTFFNVMKVMYPLLADTYALLQVIYNDDSLAGEYIGYIPISNLLRHVESSLLQNKKAIILRNSIKKKCEEHGISL